MEKIFSNILVEFLSCACRPEGISGMTLVNYIDPVFFVQIFTGAGSG